MGASVIEFEILQYDLISLGSTDLQTDAPYQTYYVMGCLDIIFLDLSGYVFPRSDVRGCEFIHILLRTIGPTVLLSFFDPEFMLLDRED